MNTKRGAMARVESTGRASGGKGGLLVLLVATAAVLLITAALSPVAGAKTTRVEICHHKASAVRYVRISVTEPEVAAHLAHGDAKPGHAVPAAPGYQFGANCSQNLVDADLDGVPDGTDNCPLIANPDQSNLYGSPNGDACEDTDGDATLDVNEADMCVSVDDVSILQAGTAGCLTTLTTGANPNIAVANGAHAYAYGAEGDNSTGTAIGDYAYAEAFGTSGDNNTATAIGDGAHAAAWGGSGATASATGNGAVAAAIHSITAGNTATANGAGAEAFADWGDSNIASANGTNAHAEAGGVSPHTSGGPLFDHNAAYASAGGFFASAHRATGCIVIDGTCQ